MSEYDGECNRYINCPFISREMQSRIVDLVGKVNNDEITAELLRLNDELNNLFLRYARYEKNRDPKTATNNTPSAILGAAMGVPITSTQTETAKDSLIDLNDQVAGAAAGGDNIDNLNSKFSALCELKIFFLYRKNLR